MLFSNIAVGAEYTNQSIQLHAPIFNEFLHYKYFYIQNVLEEGVLSIQVDVNTLRCLVSGSA